MQPGATLVILLVCSAWLCASIAVTAARWWAPLEPGTPAREEHFEQLKMPDGLSVQPCFPSLEKKKNWTKDMVTAARMFVWRPLVGNMKEADDKKTKRCYYYPEPDQKECPKKVRYFEFLKETHELDILERLPMRKCIYENKNSNEDEDEEVTDGVEEEEADSSTTIPGGALVLTNPF